MGHQFFGHLGPRVQVPQPWFRPWFTVQMVCCAVSTPTNFNAFCLIFFKTIKSQPPVCTTQPDQPLCSHTCDPPWKHTHTHTHTHTFPATEWHTQHGSRVSSSAAWLITPPWDLQWQVPQSSGWCVLNISELFWLAVLNEVWPLKMCKGLRRTLFCEQGDWSSPWPRSAPSAKRNWYVDLTNTCECV